jgi:hypothetical protein
VAAQHGLDAVGHDGRGAELASAAPFPPDQQRHHHDRRGGDADTDRRRRGVLGVEQRPHGIDADPGGEGEERHGDAAQRQPLPGLGQPNCQITTSAEETSTMESRPKPSSAVDDVAAPAATAPPLLHDRSLRWTVRSN